jgi:hypothetical protein
MPWNIEVTDTFGGETNYSWVRRYTIPSKRGDTQRGVITRAKRAAGLSGVKGETAWYGDAGDFRPRRACIAMLVQWVEPEYAFEPVQNGD